MEFPPPRAFRVGARGGRRGAGSRTAGRRHPPRLRLPSARLPRLAECDRHRRPRPAHARDFAVRDFKTYLKTVRKRSANTVNAHITALDHFFGHLGLGAVQVRRDEPSKRAPRVLDARGQKRYLRGVEARPSPRDRAIGRLLFYSGPRVSELAVLDELAHDADLVDEAGRPFASAHTLRHTFGTNLPRSGADVVVVAQLMAHRRLNTTRLYTLPKQTDLESAVAKLPTDRNLPDGADLDRERPWWVACVNVHACSVGVCPILEMSPHPRRRVVMAIGPDLAEAMGGPEPGASPMRLSTQDAVATS
jgi:hypothetical protein